MLALNVADDIHLLVHGARQPDKLRIPSVYLTPGMKVKSVILGLFIFDAVHHIEL